MPNGQKVQHSQAENLVKKADEGMVLGRRLGRNAPNPITWKVLESTFHKQKSDYDAQWRVQKKGQAAMVADIKKHIHAVPEGAEFTPLIRCLDGLIIHEESFHQFVRHLVRDRGLKLLLVFQVSRCPIEFKHPRMIPYLGLGSAMSFTGTELRAYNKSGEDPTGEIKMLFDYFTRMRKGKAKTNNGTQNRNELPDPNCLGAKFLTGTLRDDMLFLSSQTVCVDPKYCKKSSYPYRHHYQGACWAVIRPTLVANKSAESRARRRHT